MLTRTIGNIFRGSSTPVQTFLACLLGAMLGFMPGFAQALGLIVVLTLLLIILNTNSGLAGFAAIFAKLVAWPLIPFSFYVGQLLLDGPTQGLFKSMINAPVLALFGFEYYLTTGGLLVGAVLGTVMGVVSAMVINYYRRRMAGVEENSERYKKLTASRWVRFFLWLVAGKSKGKSTYSDLLSTRVGNLVNPTRVFIALLLVVVLFVIKAIFSGPIVAAYLQGGLERANGATVDIGNFDIDLGAGKLSIGNLAMADPKALDHDLIRAVKLEAKISTSDLLRKRIQMDTLVVSDASQGELRKIPGRLIGPQPAPVETPQKTEGKSLEDYIRDAQVWKERLAQARKWLDKIHPNKPADKTQTKPQTDKEKIDQQIRDSGYAHVIASHLVEGAPSFLLKDLRIEKLKADYLDADETIDVHGENLSTQPELVAEPPSISVTSSRQTLKLAIALAAASASHGANTINLAGKVPADSFAKHLIATDKPLIKGGTIDFASNGTWSPGQLDLPLSVTLHNTVVSVAGSSQSVNEVAFPITVRGSLDSPEIDPDYDAFMKSLAAAGANQVVDKLKGKALGKVGKELGKSGIDLQGDPQKELGKLLGGLGDKPQKPDKPATQPKRKKD